MQQSTNDSSFNTSRQNIEPRPFFSTWRGARRVNPLPGPRLDGRINVGGVEPVGEAAQRQEQNGDDDGFQHIRDMDRFPDQDPAWPLAPEDGNLPGGGS